MFAMKDKSAKRILYEAEVKLRKGWSQGSSMRSRDGTPLDLDLLRQGYKPHSWCLMGAVTHATMNGGRVEPSSRVHIDKAVRLLQKALARKVKKRVNFDFLVKWNDSPRRKRKDVLEVIGMAREIV